MPTKKKAVEAVKAVKVKNMPVAKKKVIKKSSKIQAAKKEMLMLDHTPVLMQETEVHKPNHTIEIHRKFVLVGACGNCEHMPMHAGKLVALLCAVVAILSVMLISQATPIDFRQFQFSFADSQPIQLDHSPTGGSR